MEIDKDMKEMKKWKIYRNKYSVAHDFLINVKAPSDIVILYLINFIITKVIFICFSGKITCVL